MGFERFSSNYLPDIESALVTCLPGVFSDSREALRQAMVYSVSAKAKRIRPLLCIAAFRLFDPDYHRILPFCSAVEWTHSYSLIHDDLPAIDNDDFRRGIPTCHKQFGEAMAILAGDTLSTYAFEYLSTELPKHFSPMASLQAMSFFAKSCGILGMAGGQAMDIQALPYSVDDMVKIHRLKTGAIIQACLVVPGILLSITKSAFVLLEEVGLHFGLLFQVVDDILDVTQNSDTLGKTAQKDVVQDKWTAVKAYGLEGAIRLARQEADLARSLLDRLGDEGYAIHDLVSILEYLLKRTF